MKLLYKLLLGYFLVILIIGAFLSFILLYNIEKNSADLSAYREREITSFVQVLNANIVDKEHLKKTEYIQKMFEATIERLPHIKRLTLHAKKSETNQYVHIVSTDIDIINAPSHTEDINAILRNKTTILYEDGKDGERLIDITYPVTNSKGHAIAALGAAVSLYASDEILNKSIKAMKDDALGNISISVALSLLISLLFALFIVKKIVSPIEKLKAVVSSFAKKDFTKKIEVNSKDEVGQLSLAFNTMAQELNMLYSSMEKQILIKTKELEVQFLTDSLTGLPNREALFKDTKKLKKFHIAILDVASFKDINDSYGVHLGNKVLQELSKKAKMHLDEFALHIYRLGADEAVILNNNIQSEQKFKETIQHLINSLEHETIYIEEEDLEINISLHAGISFESEHSIEKADIALIHAKKEHVDLVVYDKKLEAENRQVENLEMIMKIKNAINNYDFIAYYQPIVNKNREVIKYEALVRMRDKKEVLSPYFFLDIAKKTKYYPHITRAMIFQAFKEFRDKELSFSINIEADDILNEVTRDFIKNQLENFSDPSRVIFELVESESIHNIAGVHDFIDFIKNKGAKIAIDDFGTGYSNFSYLIDLKPDYLKIDGSLVVNINTDTKAYNIVKTLVSFAHNLDITVIAEFIHSQEILAVCEELDIDEFQGYYFGEPSPLIPANHSPGL
ncbi:MAG: EAL domain-containing protein [Campylobacterota bacterium]